MRRFLSLSAALMLAASIPAGADEDPLIRCHTIARSDPDPLRRDAFDGGSDRVIAMTVEHMDVLVLVPDGYEATTRRYPVVYLFQGGVNHHNCFLGLTDLIDFTASLPDDDEAIVVMPDIGSGPTWQGVQGRVEAERFFFDALVPAVDESFRTIPDPRHRAVAGFSAGGLGALMLAARNPDAFGAVAGLSAVARMDPTDPGGLVIGMGASFLLMRRDGVADPFVGFGDPYVSPLGWYTANPVEHAGNFGGLDVALFSGDGSPCSSEDLTSATAVDAWPTAFGYGEGQIRQWTEALSAALMAAGVAHGVDVGCGFHSYTKVQEEIHAWWPRMIDALGAPPPPTFDHRLADPNFSVWDWTFTADPVRAREFLDVTDASCDGFGLRGSGTTTVTTAACFAPGASVLVNDVAHAADAEGRLTLTVDLGPAHQFEQFTPAARAFEAADDGYWTSVTVSMEELS